MSVNMFGLTFFSDAHARSKNGHPPQSTTGVARMNWIHIETTAARPCGQLGTRELKSTNISDIARTNTGIVNGSEIQNRRFMSRYSGSGVSSSVISFGSSAIPHIGQLP